MTFTDSKWTPWLPKSVLSLRDYDRVTFRHDLIAGVTVGLVALPLAMAFAIASGLTRPHRQHADPGLPRAGDGEVPGRRSRVSIASREAEDSEGGNLR